MEGSPTDRPIDVFISHASADRVPAAELRRQLETRGIACWMAPDDVRGPASWAEQIVAAIERSRVVVVLISAAANASAHVAREVNLAHARAKAVLPVRLADVQPAGALEYLVTLVQRVDAFPPPADRHFERVAERVAALLEQPLPPRAAPSRRSRPAAGLLTRPTVVAGAGIALLALLVVAVLLRPPGAIDPGETSSPTTPSGTVTLDSVITEPSGVRAEGSYTNLRVGRDGVLFIGQPVDASASWLPVWATLLPSSQSAGLESGRWQAVRPAVEGGFRWYAVMGPASSGAGPVLADIREQGPESALILARSEPKTTD
jgi:hypothetical protein